MKFVVAQFVLMAAIVGACFVPPHVHLYVAAVALAVPGLLLAVWGARSLGPALSPFPEPRGPRVSRGAYARIGHPMYVGGTLFFAGVSLATSWVALALTGVLALLWWAKARVEDRLLAARFPENR